MQAVKFLFMLLFIFTNYCFGQFPNSPIAAPNLNDIHNQQSQQIQQQNRQLMIQFGHTPPPTQAEIKAAQQRHIQGKAPEPTLKDAVIKDMTQILIEAEKKNKELNETDYYQSAEYLTDQLNYIAAKDFIKDMLNGKQSLSIKDAYFKSESAYGNLLLTYAEYNKLIQSNASFIKQWLIENKYNINNNEALQFGIQKFMSDTLYIHNNGELNGHMPYYYDYIDFTAKNDRRNYFVTKTLATGTGQCHTFPVTYLILAEALGVDANLAYNPRHSFIRYKNNKGITINYETTVDRFLADAFYLQTLPVMAKAQKNKLYVFSLTKKQVVASVLYDMAANFAREHWIADKAFITECMAIAKPYFPNQEYVNGTESYLNKIMYAQTLNTLVKEKGITNAAEIEKYPDVLAAYNNYYNYMEKISNLGIQDFPESEELRMMAYADKKGRLQLAKNLNSKTKRTLFIN